MPGSPSLRAVSGVNRLAPAVPRYPCPGSGHSKLDGCHETLPGCARPRGSGSGDGRWVPAATRAGRAPRAAGRGPGRRARLPGGWAAATRQGRRVLLPAGQRLAWPRALSLHLSQCSRHPRGASREGSVRRGHLRRRGLAASASGSPRAPPGRPGALGPTRLGYGTGEVWGRGASGDRAAPPRAGVGGWRTLGGSPGRGGDPSARPVPSDPLRAPGDIRPPAEHGWCRAAAATSSPPQRPGSLGERCGPRPIAVPGQSPPLGLGGRRP